jgi:hypothetical protein
MYNPFEYFEYYKVYERISQILRCELQEPSLDPHRREQIHTELSILEESMQTISNAIDNYTPKFPPPKYNLLKQSDGRAFLRCRYVLGMTMEQTAEQMHVSRDTAYRIRRRIAQTAFAYGSSKAP